MKIIKWLENWYLQQCDGDWEHDYGFHIKTVDKPGWVINIDLLYTHLENIELDGVNYEGREDDWFSFRIKDGEYYATGDLGKLQFLLEKFKEIVEKHSRIR